MSKNSSSLDSNVVEQLETNQLLNQDLESNKSLNISDIINDNSQLGQDSDLTVTSQEKNIINSKDKIVEQLGDNQDLKADLFVRDSSKIQNLIEQNSKLNRSFGWIGTSPEEIQTDLSSSGCDCPDCCGAIAPDLDEFNGISNNFNTDTSLFAAASGDVTRVSYSGKNEIDSLIYPAKWTSKTITYSFFDGGSYYGSEGNVRPITDKMKGYLRDILESFERYIDVNFVEVSDAGNNYGQIRYMFSDGPSTAYTKVPYKYQTSPKAGDIHFNPSKTADFNAGPGSYRYETLVHETLHALDLKHPGNYNGSSTGGQSGEFLPNGDDNSNNSILSYNRLRDTPNYSGTITPMSYDIRSMQYLYGAAEYNQGDTTYKFAKIDEYTVGGEFFGNKNSNSKQTLWDSGGNDTFDFSNLKFDSSGYRFDIREGGVITSQNAYLDTTYKARGNGKYYDATSRGTFVAYDTSINNVVNSSSNDLIFANSSANVFSGYSKGKSTGNDIIKGSDGKDTLDLSDYTVSDFTNSRSGDDLVVDLKGNGSITVDDYYKAAESDRLKILTSGDNPTPTNGSLVWENQGLSDERSVATGTQFNLGNGVTATVKWQTITTDGGTFAVHDREQDYVTYDSNTLGNHNGYLSLGFNNSNDDPDDLIRLSLDFNQALTGLNFKLLDVDQARGKSFDDGVEIYADGVNIKDLAGVEIVTGNNVMADNERYMKGFEGRGNTGVDSNSEEGNIEISFGSTEVSSLEIKYFSTDDAISNPDSQKIGISDLDFQVKST
ncbi:MAG: M10 family metallopeptidase [Xenococcaceae cyanobacterium MO_188.B29]|nr:M10 family metallopeptidase [Xenococcaceae cyanobacterium MO_188.B29]